jgi:hypothetical protein
MAMMDDLQQAAANQAPDEFADDMPETGLSLTWQASEYVHHEKNALWYAGVVGGALVLCAEGRRFESCRAHQYAYVKTVERPFLLCLVR